MQFHKVQKALLLETDVSETANEMIMATRKMGSCGLIAAYAGLSKLERTADRLQLSRTQADQELLPANAFNIGALMEKGIRFIGPSLSLPCVGRVLPPEVICTDTTRSLLPSGNGQAPVQFYWQSILTDYIQTGKFDVKCVRRFCRSGAPPDLITR